MKPIGLTRAEEILEMPAVKALPTAKVPLCFACGQYHGSARIGQLCLEDAITTLRREKLEFTKKLRVSAEEAAELRTALGVAQATASRVVEGA